MIPIEDNNSNNDTILVFEVCLIKFIVKEDFDAIVFHGYLFPHVITAILAKLLKKKNYYKVHKY